MSQSNATVLESVGVSEALLINAPENAYTLSVAENHRKKFGQFFTPPAVAEFMAKWIICNPSCQTILDPSVGLGAFFRTIDKIKPQNNYRFIGYDVDPKILIEAKCLFSNSNHTNLELKIKDYLFNDWNRKYDGIICNPPYLKFQDYKNRAASLKEFQSRLNMSLSGFTNIYTMFMLKSVNQLAANGRAAYIVPFEFLNSDYGTFIKKYLLESKTLRYVILFNSEENVFNDVLTTSCILLFANDDNSESVKFINAEDVESLQGIEEQIASYPDINDIGKSVICSNLDPNIKWRTYYQTLNNRTFKNLVTFSTYAKIVRGIATGDNDYFTFNEKKKAEFKIRDEFLLPCLTKAAQAKTNFFSSSEYENLRLNEDKIFLFNAFNLTDRNVRKYIKHGEELEVQKGYLTSHRNPWHTIENRPPAPIIVTVFNRNGLRFVRNEANIRNLTCFHAIYLNMFASAKIDLLMAYFLSDVSKEIFNHDRREYGGGLNKFEPNDLNNSKMINLDAIDLETENLIETLYNRYRESVLCSQVDAEALGNLNDIFSSFVVE
ncbi:MAG: N-6 DNA methylase [Pyrinomonadaceae bacterium]